MFDRDLWSEIFYSIKKNKLRTFLTGFSVAWGIFILVLLLASVKGMENGFTSQFNDDASNAVFVRPFQTTKAYNGFEPGRSIKFTNKDIDYIKGNFKDEVQYITPIYVRSFTAKYKKETGEYSVRAVNQDNTAIENIKLLEGRLLVANDIEKKLKVVIIGKKVKEDLFLEESPIGKTLLLNNSAYKVIGVFSDNDNDRDERVINVPITTLQQIYGNTDRIAFIGLTYNPKLSYLEAINFTEMLQVLLKRRHNVDPDDQGAIYLNSNAEEFTEVSNFTKMLQGISLGVGVLILLAGIIGIGNILVFIIKERTKEIGIRKALGAKPSQVISLVLLESIFITTISGFVGLLFAVFLVNTVMSKVSTQAFKNPTVDIKIVVIALLILVISGVLAGLIPAIKAAKVKPIVALRAD